MPVYRTDNEGPEQPRLPRLGIIRLGVKETRHRANGEEYAFPKATDYFVLDDAPGLAEIFGPKPTVLEPVIIPGEDEEIVASHWLRAYSATWGLTCIGDKRQAHRHVDAQVLAKTGELRHANRDTQEAAWKDVQCPCDFLDNGQCRETMYLRFILPTVPGLGIWQLSTGSRNSIRNIQGTFALLRGLVGRMSGIPLRLSLVPQEVIPAERGGRKTVHVLRLDPAEGASVMDLLAKTKGLATVRLMPMLEEVKPEDESPPEDVAADATPVPPEIEEADYLKPAELMDEPQQAPPVAPAKPVPHAVPHAETEALRELVVSYGMDPVHHLPIILGGRLGDFLRDGHTMEDATRLVREKGEARKKNQPRQPVDSEQPSPQER